MTNSTTDQLTIGIRQLTFYTIALDIDGNRDHGDNDNNYVGFTYLTQSEEETNEEDERDKMAFLEHLKEMEIY